MQAESLAEARELVTPQCKLMVCATYVKGAAWARCLAVFLKACARSWRALHGLKHKCRMCAQFATLEWWSPCRKRLRCCVLIQIIQTVDCRRASGSGCRAKLAGNGRRSVRTFFGELKATCTNRSVKPLCVSDGRAPGSLQVCWANQQSRVHRGVHSYTVQCRQGCIEVLLRPKAFFAARKAK